MIKIPVFILAGGQSTRFGTDKARAEIDGEPALIRIMKQISPWASTITLVCENANKYQDFGVRTIVDPIPRLGPKGGLIAALGDLDAHQDFLLLCPCDVVTIKDVWIRQLFENCIGYDAVAFRDEKYWQPLPALYGKNCYQVAKHQIDTGNRSMQALLKNVNACSLTLPKDWHELGGFNTRVEWDAYKK